MILVDILPIGLFNGQNPLSLTKVICHQSLKLNINNWDIPFPKSFKKLSMNWEKHFSLLGKWNKPIGNSAHTTKCLVKRPWDYIYLAYVNKSMALVNELKRLKYKYSLVFTIIFRFLRTLLITLILDERYMCCSIKIQNNSPHNYIAYSLASYYFRGETFC